jgi:hypothetical protein
MKRRWKKEQGGPAHPAQKGAARDLAFFRVVACHRWVLEELQISVVMLALKYSQAKRAAFFRNREKIVRPFQRHTASSANSAGTKPAKRAKEQGWQDS